MSKNTTSLEEQARECIVLQEEFRKNSGKHPFLYDQIRNLVPKLMLYNLSLLNIPDILVTVYENTDRILSKTGTPLTLQCAEQFSGLECMSTLIKKSIGITRTVWEDGYYIGEIDPLGQFKYHEAPNLKALLGWIAVTDGGRFTIFDFDIEEVVETLHAVIRHNKPNQETYATVFGLTVKSMFQQHKLTMFSDTHSFHVWRLWKQVLKDADIHVSHEEFLSK